MTGTKPIKGKREGVAVFLTCEIVEIAEISAEPLDGNFKFSPEQYSRNLGRPYLYPILYNEP